MVGFELADGAAGAIFAALIAGLISLLGLMISKEQKVSEFRQAWIDALRADIAAVITHSHAIHGAHLAKFPSNAELWKNVRGDFIGINEAEARIRLRLNPREKSSIAVLQVLGERDSLFTVGAEPDFGRIAILDDKLLDSAQKLLKQEWLRVRRGEMVFRIAKLMAFLVTALFVLILVWRVAASWHF